MDRLDRLQGQAVAGCPVKKLAHGAAIGLAGVFIADLSGKEFDDAAGGFLAAVIEIQEPRARRSQLPDKISHSSSFFLYRITGFILYKYWHTNKPCNSQLENMNLPET